MEIERLLQDATDTLEARWEGLDDEALSAEIAKYRRALTDVSRRLAGLGACAAVLGHLITHAMSHGVRGCQRPCSAWPLPNRARRRYCAQALRWTWRQMRRWRAVAAGRRAQTRWGWRGWTTPWVRWMTLTPASGRCGE